MTFEHRSGLPRAYDRAVSKPTWARPVVPEKVFFTGSNINELVTMAERRLRRVGGLVANDGDRAEGAAIYVKADPEPATTFTVNLNAGRVYIEGDVLPVEAETFANIDLAGDIKIGVRLQRTLVTHEEDSDLLGLEPGTDAYLDICASVETEELVWAIEGDAQAGDFYPVYLLRDGTVIDQTPPPDLTGVQNVVALYDQDANGNYIVGRQSCVVTALGKFGSDQVFALGPGTANIRGQKRTRNMALRFAVEEEPDLEAIAGEVHTYTTAGGADHVVAVSRPPIAAIDSVIIVKRTTEVVTRGPVPGGSDDLQHSSVVEIESIAGYTIGDDFVLAGDAVSWAPAGAEPANGATYSVTYLYNAAVTPTGVTDTEFTVTGGVEGKPILVSYDSKLPRIDVIGLDVNGLPVNIKGVARRSNRLPPLAPSSVLKLAEVHNDWLGTPAILNNGTRNYTFDDMVRMFGLVITMAEQFDRAENRRTIMEFDPTAKGGIFTDGLLDDYYRDSGAAQTAAVNNGTLELAVDPVDRHSLLTAPLTLDYTEEVIVEQLLETSSFKIAPYLSYDILPGSLKLEPPVDHWTVGDETFTSDTTREFTVVRSGPPTTSVDVTQNLEGVSVGQAETLRQIDVQFTLDGFASGEDLASLTFGGVDVLPDPAPTADGNGQIVDTFTIPAGMPVGRHAVLAEGAAGSYAQALFVGSGAVVTSELSRVTTITNSVEPVVVEPVRGEASGFNSGDPGSNRPPKDPTAITFTPPEEGRMVLGVNLKMAAVGDDAEPVYVRLVHVRDGDPTRDILAEAMVDMTGVEAGDVVEARFAVPVYLPADRFFAFKMITADPDHAIAIARIGEVTADQKRVSAQPYILGNLLSASNNVSWLVHPDIAPWVQIVAASFDPTTKTQNLWTGTFADITDIVVKGQPEIPTADASARFELVRQGGEVVKFQANQPVEFDERLSEDVTLRAVLVGTEKIAPILWPFMSFGTGRIRTSGTYITRVFDIGTGVAVRAIFAGQLPAGSSVSVDVDAADDNWVALGSLGSKVLGENWTEYRYEKDPYSATEGRIRITLNGDADARLKLALVRAYSV